MRSFIYVNRFSQVYKLFHMLAKMQHRCTQKKGSMIVVCVYPFQSFFIDLCVLQRLFTEYNIIFLPIKQIERLKP